MKKFLALFTVVGLLGLTTGCPDTNKKVETKKTVKEDTTKVNGTTVKDKKVEHVDKTTTTDKNPDHKTTTTDKTKTDTKPDTKPEPKIEPEPTKKTEEKKTEEKKTTEKKEEKK